MKASGIARCINLLLASVVALAACGGSQTAQSAPSHPPRRLSTSNTSTSRLPTSPPLGSRPGAGSSTRPAGNWAIPGRAIDNLDTAPGSPYRAGEKVVALTFDDGPSPTYTPQILRVLVADRAPASFEIIGEYGAADPGILGDEAEDGMSLVNHTWSHVDIATLPAPEWASEIVRTDDLIEDVTGHPVRCLRPPYDLTNAAVLTGLRRLRLAQLGWDIDPSDYLKPGVPVIVRRVLSALHPGAIIIMHDGGGDRSQTVAALPSLISGIRARGYRIVPVCGG
jgi:peptidoglycan-N-acetylglucosamine deacetylase